MDVVRVDKLGDIVAFRPKVIEVRGAEYDSVPAERLEDLCSVLNIARDTYYNKCEASKSTGRVSPRVVKKEVVDSIVKPFLINFNASIVKPMTPVVTRTVKPSKPSISLPKDKIEVNVSEADVELAKKYYDNNFDSSILDDSSSEEVLVDFGGSDKLFDSSDDFVIEGL